ncbi:MAG TPA: hypothetical protein VG106_13330, partial [Vicinamibacterales bacterium]|nr:hypothetical protein [Vicinamibacterales bacterium]
MHVRRFGALGVIVLAAASAAAQTDSQAPVFRAGVELVRLDVRVVDADGRPVANLRREELEVLENGRTRSTPARKTGACESVCAAADAAARTMTPSAPNLRTCMAGAP